MTSRERFLKAINHEHVDRTPMDPWQLYGVLMMRQDDYAQLMGEFDFDVVPAEGVTMGKGERAKGDYCEIGEWVDDWGCVHQVGERGLCGEVKTPLFEDWSGLDQYKPPFEVLDNADLSGVNKFYASTDKAVKGGGGCNPFERLQALRGTENTFIDLAYGTKEMFQMLEMIHDYNCRFLRMWAETDFDILQFMDDWGSQTSLLISPEMWREIFKPLYKDYCDILKGRNILFHSDGFIEPIFPDLIELGVTAVNAQLFCMDMEKLGQLYKGKIVFYGEICRQNILPFGTTEDCREAVRRVRLAVDDDKGGVVAECCWGLKDPLENIEAVYDEWSRPYNTIYESATEKTDHE
ncbi:uroporphyrinogen decarboxylase family protein [Candidatus Hydrogenedentota bacterium]